MARRKLLLLIFSLAAITYMDRLLISAAAPSIAREFDFTPSQMGYIFSAFATAYALFEVPSGWWGDAIGTRLVLARIVLSWSAFTALTGAVTGFWSLFTVRLLFGAGEAGAFPNIARTVAQWFPRPEQGRAMSVSFFGLAIGSAFTAPLAFPLIELQGWRTVFLEFGLLGVAWTVVWYLWFRDRPEDHPGVGPGELRTIRADRATAEELRLSHHAPWRELFRSSNLAAICGMYFAYGYGLYFYITWLPTYLLKARGFPAEYTAWFSSLPWVFSAAGMLLGGWLTDSIAQRTGNLRLARNAVGVAGYALSGLILVAVALTPHRVVAASLLACAAFAQMTTASAAWSVCLDVGRAKAGVVTGFMNTAGNIGGALAPVVVGYAVQYWGSWNIPFYISSAVFAFGIAMWMMVDPRQSVLGTRPLRRP
jgi:sugar phosphate permease